MPKTTLLWLICAGSIAGIPLLSGFVSKWLLFNAALQSGQVVPALVSWVVSVITVFSFLKATSGVFLGEDMPARASVHEAPWPMVAGAGVLAVACLLIGIAPQLAMQYIINPLLPAVGGLPVVGISWLGLTVATGSWFATGGLILTVVAVGAGALMYWRVGPAPQAAAAGAGGLGVGGGVFTGGEPLSGAGRLPASDFSLIVKQSLAPFYSWVDADRYYRGVWRGLLAVSVKVNEFSRWLERRAMLALPGLGAVLFVVALTAGAVPGASPAPPAARVTNYLLVAGTGLALLALLLTASAFRPTRRALPWLLIPGALAGVGLMVEGALARLLLLEGAAVLALWLVWQTSQARAASQVYLLAVLLSVAATVGGTLLLSVAPQAAFALLLTSVAVKLALVPLYLWLPAVAEAVPAVVAGLVVSVVDVSAFGELLTLRQSTPWLFAPSAFWLTLALLSALGGAVLMLAQHDLKRLLAFSTIEDMGYLVLALTAGGEAGPAAAALGATVHAVAKALLFISLSAVEPDEPPTLAARGLAARYPLSSAGFLVGSLAMLGVPPTVGFAARWQLYGAAAQAGPGFLAGLIAASGLAVLAYARVIAKCWWGPGPAGATRRPEPVALAIALAGLSLVLLLAGVWPGALAR